MYMNSSAGIFESIQIEICIRNIEQFSHSVRNRVNDQIKVNNSLTSG